MGLLALLSVVLDFLGFDCRFLVFEGLEPRTHLVLHRLKLLFALFFSLVVFDCIAQELKVVFVEFVVDLQLFFFDSFGNFDRGFFVGDFGISRRFLGLRLRRDLFLGRN